MSGRAKGKGAATQQPALAFAVRDVGGVRELAVTLEPGVNILRGANGAGKTSALRAITRAMGGDVALEVRDGAPLGTVEGPGVVLTVRKVVRRTGAAEVGLADCGALAQLIDPGVDDDAAAARARVRALLQLLPMPATDEAMALLAGGDGELLAAARDRVVAIGGRLDLLAAAEVVRGVAQAAARQAERAAAEATGRQTAARAALERLGPCAIGVVGPEDEAAAGRDLQDAIRTHERAVVGLEARTALEQRQEAIATSLGERPDDQRSLAEYQRAAAETTRLRGELHAAEQRENEAGWASRRDALAVVRWDEQRAVLDQPLDGPTAGEVAALADRRRAADERLAALQAARQHTAGEAELTAATEASLDATQRGEALRAIAAGVDRRIGELLGRAGAAGLTVVNGRLALVDGNELRDFATRLSDGQRIAAALRVASAAYAGKVVPLAGEYWQALDPERRAELARIAEDLGLYIITEQPAEGGLRIEHEEAEVVQREVMQGRAGVESGARPVGPSGAGQ